MKRISDIAGTGVFLLLAPGTVAGLVPWWITRWRMQPPLLGFSGFRVIGALMIAAGIAVVLDSFARFALQGVGHRLQFSPPVTLLSGVSINTCEIRCMSEYWGSY